uniref:G-patch domain-containing protein n=2 Tax=Clastoptera arizonana TaxID=38151 RepID=A0A1B6C7P5_9HEMI
MNFKVDTYRKVTDSEEQWEQKKLFMTTHWYKYPEEKLISLAETFYNINFLGCSYSKTVMENIGELAKALPKKRVRFQKGGDTETKANKRKRLRNFTELTDIQDTGDLESLDQKINDKMKELSETISPLGFPMTFIICTDLDHKVGPVNIIQNTSVINKCSMETKNNKNNKGEICCEVSLDGIALGCESDLCPKKAKRKAMIATYKMLIMYHYVLEKKSTEFLVKSATFIDLLNKSAESNQIPKSNIGCQMMKKMGWNEGAGLGHNEEGIMQPVLESGHLTSRAGLGSCLAPQKTATMQNTIDHVLKAYVINDSYQDLVFCAGLESEDRKTIHKLAHRYNLKSMSSGEEPNRVLLVSKRPSYARIVSEILTKGQDGMDKYILFAPNTYSNIPYI